jgi:hypothetical protein
MKGSRLFHFYNAKAVRNWASTHGKKRKHAASIDNCAFLDQETDNVWLPEVGGNVKGSPPSSVYNASVPRPWTSK